MSSPLPPDSYCAHAGDHPLHRRYHDEAYGFPLSDDDALFGRLVMEINQAGLSWLTILKKEETLRAAYSDFSVEAVAGYADRERERLLADAGVIRNRRKVEAAIQNARAIRELQRSHGSFRSWLDAQHPRRKPAWVRLFRDHFRFTGGEITGEFLMSTGYLPGAHHPACSVFGRVRRAGAPWLEVAPDGGWDHPWIQP